MIEADQRVSPGAVSLFPNSMENASQGKWESPKGSGRFHAVRDTAPTVMAGAVRRASLRVQGEQWTDWAMVSGVILTPGWATLPAWMP